MEGYPDREYDTMNAKDGAKRLLCFGDSNTWGCVPTGDESRYSPSVRWTGRLQNLLGEGYEIIEEGLNSRYVGISDDRPGKEGKNAMEYILPCIDSHEPIDNVIVMLGTNDMRARYSLEPEEIGEKMDKLIRLMMDRGHKGEGEIILVAPPYVNENTYYTARRYAGAGEKSRSLGKVYSAIAERYGMTFVDAGPIAKVGDDGVHITEEGHAKLAGKLAQVMGC